ncbi:MAG: EthD domain-containing protein [Pseudomonadota bacterium]
MFKIIYAEKRRPELSFTTFVRRWRQHAGLAMQDAPFWNPMALYIQNDALRGIPGTDQAYDGVGELFYPTLLDLNASLASPGLVPIMADGDEFFSRVDQIHMVVDQRPLRTGHCAGFKVFIFARAPQGGGRADFADHCADRTETLLRGQGEFARSARQVTIGQGATQHDPYDLVCDATFDSTEAARLGNAEWLGALRVDGLAADGVAIAARSYVLYDAPYAT